MFSNRTEDLYEKENSSYIYKNNTTAESSHSPIELIDYSKTAPSEIVEFGPNGRYAKLNSLLGKGAYKIVYKALDREEGYEVAWNCFQRTSIAEYKEFSSEIEILKKVRHPNIISFHDCWYNNNEFVFITELMTSGTLREYIHVLKSPNLKIVKRWTKQILRGICYLHSHDPPIVHRDIKCDNIFINGAHGEVKIGDMGTAKMKMGTPEFMAPEMYEEKGYSEKVDIYAFGMCLLEMVTGEYPYIECTNAAQVYRRVSQGMKPEGLSKVNDADVLDLIHNCISDENIRFSTHMVMDHRFLAHDPEVVLLSISVNVLTLQVVFKGSENLSIKFEFNKDKDTAEDVVNEMIEENVLPDTFRNLVKFEINRILRDLSKPSLEESSSFNSSYESWRLERGFQNQLDNAKKKLIQANEKLQEAEKKAILSEQRALAAEEINRTQNSPNNTTITRKNSSTHNSGKNILVNAFRKIRGDSHHKNASLDYDMNTKSKELDESSTTSSLRDVDLKDDSSIEVLVNYVAISTNRGQEKEKEWLIKLKEQDIITVGDLKKLHQEDWTNLGLSVFACRALRNCLSRSSNEQTNIIN